MLSYVCHICYVSCVICIILLFLNSKYLEEIEDLKREKTVMQQKIDDLKEKTGVRLQIHKHVLCVVIISPTELCLSDHVNLVSIIGPHL